MGLQRLFVSILRPHCDPRTLVLVINANQTALELAAEELSLTTNHPPTILSTEQTSEERKDIYLSGGLFPSLKQHPAQDLLKTSCSIGA